ncbi:pilus assembly protein CpaE [Herbiconiux sp. KACC 21604]|uniref:pilus assembly protein CpaE n=1 Tax=unclassified Herbiconiux TaxID=2618217 RepID=UPI0014921F13|nr:pilus assembly protein CpaE [Herbiconiux sp. SALV-R1]QJU53305.1 pilus assembly protein CpaE [Herbiconiux sp. SALV-R1]WPO88263.1 pilus assembly protein CpaE [Herbiconiux sp. KACC 21604]
MISIELARALRTAGLRWHPRSQDGFVVESAEGDGEVYTVSEMTVDVHEYPTGTLIGFNGTTEWALDSVALADTLWLPREDQLRELLRDGFHGLEIDRGFDPPRFLVTATVRGNRRVYEAESAADAYGEALLDLIVQSLVAEPGSDVGPPQ